MEPRISSLVDDTQLGHEADSLNTSSTATFSGTNDESSTLQPKVTYRSGGHQHLQDSRGLKLSAAVPSSSSGAHETLKNDEKLTKSTVPLTEVLNPDGVPEDADSFRSAISHGTKSSQKEKESRTESGVAKNVITLPEPKSARKGKQRPRIPPLLQGLHQPPPDARLFPPITANSIIPARNVDFERTAVETQGTHGKVASTRKTDLKDQSISFSEKGKIVRQRRKWSEEETKNLLRGLGKHGIGRWKDILTDPELSFDGRRAADLKDRY